MQITHDKVIYNSQEFYTIEVKLPKTTLLVIGNDIGFVMCGALDVDIYNTPKLLERKVVCANALGVKTIDDLFNATINSATLEAESLGIKKGVSVRDALLLMV